MLPELRQDLSIHTGPRDAHGAPTWTLHDPVRNKYFQLPWAAVEVLSRWRLDSAPAIVAAVNAETTLKITEEIVQSVVEMLLRNNLTVASQPEDTTRMVQQVEQSQSSWWTWLLHHYLFFRIPIVNPDRFLTKTLPIASIFFSKQFAWLTGGVFLLGIFLAGRQWEQFTATFVDTISLGGFLAYGLTYLFVKVLHELGHGYAVKRYGKPVPAMGLAFLVMWPVLYTDTNAVWEIPDKRKRMHVALSGVLTEIVIAAWATLAWSLLPEGPLKAAAFLLATVTWVSSVLLNLSPFMRFDGYFVLMDGFNFPNLHERAFAQARWKIREWLFALGAPSPEKLSPLPSAFLIVFAFCTWLYRLILFLGIAVLVYHFFIKLIGILLFIVEMLWFVIKPIWNEMKIWWSLRDKVSQSPRRMWLIGGVFFAVGLLLVPWKGQESVPAILKATQFSSVYALNSGQLTQLHVTEGQRVKAGDVLAELHSPDQTHELQKTRIQIAQLHQELQSARVDVQLAQTREIVQQRLSMLQAKEKGLQQRLEQNQIRADFDGIVTDISPELSTGQWLAEDELLFSLRSQSTPQIVAYVPETFIHRLNQRVDSKFYADDFGMGAVPVHVKSVRHSAVSWLDDLPLASIHGGAVAVRPGQNRLHTIEPLYVVRLEPQKSLGHTSMEITGTVNLSVKGESILYSMWRAVAGLLIRESGM